MAIWNSPPTLTGTRNNGHDFGMQAASGYTPSGIRIAAGDPAPTASQVVDGSYPSTLERVTGLSGIPITLSFVTASQATTYDYYFSGTDGSGLLPLISLTSLTTSGVYGAHVTVTPAIVKTKTVPNTVVTSTRMPGLTVDTVKTVINFGDTDVPSVTTVPGSFVSPDDLYIYVWSAITESGRYQKDRWQFRFELATPTYRVISPAAPLTGAYHGFDAALWNESVEGLYFSGGDYTLSLLFYPLADKNLDEFIVRAASYSGVDQTVEYRMTDVGFGTYLDFQTYQDSSTVVNPPVTFATASTDGAGGFWSLDVNYSNSPTGPAFFSFVEIERIYIPGKLITKIEDIRVREGDSGSKDISSYISSYNEFPQTFSISPALPSGFTFNTSTGLLSWDGTQGIFDKQKYTVTWDQADFQTITTSFTIDSYRENIPFDGEIYFNFGNTSITGWNNITSTASGVKVSNAVNGAGVSTGVGLELISAGSAINTHTTMLPATSRGIPKTVYNEYMEFASPSVVRLTGLTVGASYAIKCYGYTGVAETNDFTQDVTTTGYASTTDVIPTKPVIFTLIPSSSTVDITVNKVNAIIVSLASPDSVDKSNAGELSTFTTRTDPLAFTSVSYGGVSMPTPTKTDSTHFTSTMPADGVELGVNHDFTFVADQSEPDISTIFTAGRNGDAWIFDIDTTNVVVAGSNIWSDDTTGSVNGNVLAFGGNLASTVMLGDSGFWSHMMSTAIQQKWTTSIDVTARGFSQFYIATLSGEPSLSFYDNEVNFFWVNNHAAPQVVYSNEVPGAYEWDMTGVYTDRLQSSLLNDGKPHLIGTVYDAATTTTKAIVDGQVIGTVVGPSPITTITEVVFLSGSRQGMEINTYAALFVDDVLSDSEIDTVFRWAVHQSYIDGVPN